MAQQTISLSFAFDFHVETDGDPVNPESLRDKFEKCFASFRDRQFDQKLSRRLQYPMYVEKLYDMLDRIAEEAVAGAIPKGSPPFGLKLRTRTRIELCEPVCKDEPVT